MSKQWGHGYRTAKDEAYFDELARMGADEAMRWKWHRFRCLVWWRYIIFDKFFRKFPF